VKLQAEVIAVSVRPHDGLIYDAATWAAVRRRVLAKAVAYNEVVLTRLRARLDALPPPPTDQPPNGAGQPGWPTSTLTPPASNASQAVAREAAPPVEPEQSAPSLSPWLPRAVAEAYREAPESRQQEVISRASSPSPQSAHPRPSAPPPATAQRGSAQRVKPSENVSKKRKRRRLLVAIPSILLLSAVVAGGVLLYYHARSSTSPVTAPPPAAARAFALPVVRHNRPRRFSIVLTRVALVTRASLRTARASAPPRSGAGASARLG